MFPELFHPPIAQTSNYALPELNALNAPVEISASTIVVEEAVSAQLVDLSTSGQDAFAKNVEYGIKLVIVVHLQIII